jgi:epoxyqueuosine reductase
MLNNKIKRLLEGLQVDYFGVADISLYENDLVKLGGDIVRGYGFGLSLGIVLPTAIIEGLGNRFDKNNASLYRSHAYDVINARLDNAASVVSSFLNSGGYASLPIQAAERTDIENALPTVSHKMIARLAGLGWIGKNGLLLTAKHGPRVRWTSVLANGPFNATKRVNERECGKCSECVTICPVRAISGRTFDVREEREAHFDFRKCHNYFEEMKKDETRKAVCGMCLYICPVGRKKKAR